MGIYDRDYMSDESAARARFSGVATLIIINIVVWVLWQLTPQNAALAQFMEANFLVSAPAVFEHFRVHTLLTCAVSHQDFWHIVFNLLFFWFLGRDVEAIYGRANMFVLYFFCAAAASLLQIGLDVALYPPSSLAYHVPSLGASGAVMGVAVVAALFDPNKPMLFMGFIPIRLKWLVLLFVLADLVGLGESAPSRQPLTGELVMIARAAHLGGALAGLLFWKFDLRLFRRRDGQSGLWQRLRSLFRRKPRLRVVESRRIEREDAREIVGTATATRSSPSVDAETARRVDELLDKIHREGLAALTDEERAFLSASSQKYRKH